ncbi:MAG: NADH-quinone oxidoreductase subunit NuoE [Spirochaetes bacterium]|nr:NADH-quinone oxidoreductase subunit NuoE [Spirochaetota bacterium]
MEQAFRALLEQWRGAKGNVIPLLQKTQDIFGFLPQEAMGEIARVTGKAPAEIYGVATFYAQFRFKPYGKHVMKVCHGTACHVQGADSLDTVVEMKLGVKPGDTTSDGEFSVERVACLGCCSLAPVVMIDGEVYGRLTGDKVGKIVSTVRGKTVRGEK